MKDKHNIQCNISEFYIKLTREKTKNVKFHVTYIKQITDVLLSNAWIFQPKVTAVNGSILSTQLNFVDISISFPKNK